MGQGVTTYSWQPGISSCFRGLGFVVLFLPMYFIEA